MISDSKNGIVFAIYNLDNLPDYIYRSDGIEIYCAYDMNGKRVRKSLVGSTDRFYFYGKDGGAEAVCLLPYSSDLTYNILGNGNDNIGQVRVQNGSVSGRYYYLKDHLGSVRMMVDAGGNVVGYDDYYPYGMTMTGRSKVPSTEDSRYKFITKRGRQERKEMQRLT